MSTLLTLHLLFTNTEKIVNNATAADGRISWIPPNLPINDKTKGTQNKNIKNQLGDNAAQ